VRTSLARPALRVGLCWIAPGPDVALHTPTWPENDAAPPRAMPRRLSVRLIRRR
jgi:hypothetical protein